MRILWAALGAVLLPTATAAQGDPANAKWRECVVASLQPRDMLTGSVGAIGVRVSIQCKEHYKGPGGQVDVDVIVGLLEKLRSQQPKEPEMVIEPARPLPPSDKRF